MLEALNKTKLSPVIRCLGIFAILLTAAGFQSQAIAQDKVVAIINAVIIDGNGKSPIKGGSIIIRNDKIQAVGNNLTIPTGAQIIDAAGQVAMPGLADMHVHLTWGGEGFDI
ncbi:MAG: hypothetical protein MJK04_27790 [Psychrosphaera sp.]|nr:hypothetical protein [Psychrosphaera sp.]